MKTLTSFVTLMLLFFLTTTGVLFIMNDIGAKNENLDVDSLGMITSLNTWEQTTVNYTFVENPGNYSLTGYETVEPEDKDNAESKGALKVFLFLGDSFKIIPTFISNMLPRQFSYAVSYLTALLVVVLGYFFTIAVYNAWKARRT